MRRKKNISGRKNQEGIIITLVAVCMLGFVGAMAALSIDVVALYTARSEAQLVADAAALAGARVLANSGMTSATGGGLTTAAEILAKKVATQVAASSMVGGRYLVAGGPEISVGFTHDGAPPTDPRVTVNVQRSDLPTYFARIWGTTQVKVAATATAEAYNPSNSTATAIPVAPLCVKPWLLPNVDPSNSNQPIFDPASGTITSGSILLGWSSVPAGTGPLPQMVLSPDCLATGGCTPSNQTNAQLAWKYYPGDPATTFGTPIQAPLACSQMPSPTTYQLGIAGCIQTPISCNSPTGNLPNIDLATYAGVDRNADTADAVNCMTHATQTGGGDTVNTTATSSSAATAPFQFVAGADNPISSLSGNVMVSDSLVTVPVFDTTNFGTGSTNVHIVGFVQLFLNPAGTGAVESGPGMGNIDSTVINIVGCGTNASGTAIQGNGASPVAVRLISAS